MSAVFRWLSDLLPTNPIVVRLVQGGSRRMQHMYVRAAYLAVLIIVLLGLLLQQVQGDVTSLRDLAANGARAFEIVAYLQVALICILAPVFMAGAIAQESNPRTWDILLTTPLNAVQIVLGILFGRLFFVLALLSASLPLFAVTQFFGGVPGSAVLLSYVVSACAALLVGATAVVLAVNRLVGRRTVFAFYVAVVTYLAVTWVIDLQLRPGMPWGGVTVMTALNPFLALQALLNPTSYEGPDELAMQAMSGLGRFWFGSPVAAWTTVSLGVSLALMLTSALTVRNLGSRNSVPWYRRMLHLGARGAGTRPARTVGTNPIAWREAKARAATLPMILVRWSFVLAGVLWGLGVIAYYHGGGMGHEVFRQILLATVITEIAVVTLVAINMSATAISREREDGTLDLLLTTPVTPKEYMGGKLLGLIAFLLPLLSVPIATVAMASIYVLAGGLGREDGIMVPANFGAAAPVDIPVVLPEVGLLFPLVLVPFVAFCVMIGLQWSLKSRGTVGAVVATVGVVGVLGGLMGLCGWQAASSIVILGPALSAMNPVTLLFSLVNTEQMFSPSGVNNPSDLPDARIAGVVGALVAVGIYVSIVLALRASMDRTFDMTTRKLAGNS
ncbi:MAG: hypothetical protein EA380_09670 [Phycisphaeraceae bacterium]|nr:MAG: hypothetical protein EA380_09670 [Phycisphaeraceae bacterium]